MKILPSASLNKTFYPLLADLQKTSSPLPHQQSTISKGDCFFIAFFKFIKNAFFSLFCCCCKAGPESPYAWLDEEAAFDIVHLLKTEKPQGVTIKKIKDLEFSYDDNGQTFRLIFTIHALFGLEWGLYDNENKPVRHGAVAYGRKFIYRDVVDGETRTLHIFSESTSHIVRLVKCENGFEVIGKPTTEIISLILGTTNHRLVWKCSVEDDHVGFHNLVNSSFKLKEDNLFVLGD